MNSVKRPSELKQEPPFRIKTVTRFCSVHSRTFLPPQVMTTHSVAEIEKNIVNRILEIKQSKAHSFSPKLTVHANIVPSPATRNATPSTVGVHQTKIKRNEYLKTHVKF
jgi:hypothetical protein